MLSGAFEEKKTIIINLILYYTFVCLHVDETYCTKVSPHNSRANSLLVNITKLNQLTHKGDGRSLSNKPSSDCCKFFVSKCQKN